MVNLSTASVLAWSHARWDVAKCFKNTRARELHGEIDARCGVSNADVLNRHASNVLKERRIAVMFREPATAVRRAKW
jgi:hypothetical protein